MLSIPAQQGRVEQYELNPMPSVPFSCFFDVAEAFGYGRPNELDDLVEFPRRAPVIPCEEWPRGASASVGESEGAVVEARDPESDRC